jgi:hypothetical protein
MTAGPPAGCWLAMKKWLGLGLMAVLVSACSVSVGVEFGEPDVPESTRVQRQESPAVPSRIGTPEVAGGLSRSRDTETKYADQLAQARTQLRPDAVVSDSVVSAIYHRAGFTAPDGDIVFMGGAVRDPAPLLAEISGRPGNLPQGWQSIDVDFGPSGGRGACAEGPNSAGTVQPSCIWVTGDSFGHLVPFPAASGVPTMLELADLMKNMRPDLEH